MAIYLKCCGKDHVKSKRKCDICKKSFTKFVVKVKDSSTGKWKTQTVHSFKLAKELEAKFKTEILEGRFFDKAKISVIEFEKYLEYAKLHKKSWRDDLSRWNLHVKDNDYSNKKGISTILGEMKEKGYAVATIHHVKKLIQRVINWSTENGYYFEQNPCKLIKLPKYDNSLTTYLSQDEMQELLSILSNWNNFRASSVVFFGMYTGRRKSEITNLLWQDVDLINKSITCRTTKNGHTLSFPLNQKAFDVILQAYEKKISDFVFPSATGTNYYRGFSLAWQRMKKRFGIRYRFHDLRSNYASHLASSGKVDIYTLKNLLGHNSVVQTMRYAHLTNDAVKQANNVIDEIF